MYKKLSECPVCKSSSFVNHLICKDYLVSEEEFAIVKCEECGFLFTNPRPTENNLLKYYESSDYKSHHNNKKTLIDLVYNTVRRISLANKLSIINSLKTEKTILDIGVGTGHFLQTTKKNGWTIAGVEPAESARKEASNLLQTDLYADITAIQEKKFDVITLWHVLEHIEDLNKSLETIRDLLKKNGYLVIAVPNVDSWDAVEYKQYWAAYDVPRHLSHFTKDTMKKLLKNHKLKIEKVAPMKFDSYYISLLSEKNKTGKANYIEVIKTGWKSNNWASKNDDNYSSLIYIISKK